MVYPSFNKLFNRDQASLSKLDSQMEILPVYCWETQLSSKHSESGIWERNMPERDSRSLQKFLWMKVEEPLSSSSLKVLKSIKQGQILMDIMPIFPNHFWSAFLLKDSICLPWYCTRLSSIASFTSISLVLMTKYIKTNKCKAVVPLFSLSEEESTSFLVGPGGRGWPLKCPCTLPLICSNGKRTP